MTDLTPLDIAFAAMDSDVENETLRLHFFERLADAELFVLLTEEAEGDNITPALFPVEGETYLLAFDRLDRLTQFTDGPAPYAGLSGRLLVDMMHRADLGLGLNLEVAPSSQLFAPQAMAWLAGTLENGPDETEDKPKEIAPPRGLPEQLLTSLDTKLALAEGLAQAAYLAEVTYESGVRTHMLAFIDPLPYAPPALAQAVNEALTFSGIEAGSLDVTFLKASDPLCATLARHGLRFDLPKMQKPSEPKAPGMDPSTPPLLR